MRDLADIGSVDDVLPLRIGLNAHTRLDLETLDSEKPVIIGVTVVTDERVPI